MWVCGEIHDFGLYCILSLSSGGRGRWPIGCLFPIFISGAKLQLLRPNQENPVGFKLGIGRQLTEEL